MEIGSTLAVTSNWLDVTPSSDGELTIGSTEFSGSYCYWPYYPVYATSVARPIKLTMSEVERLRKAAKADEKLKSILKKFTQQIEITVDFE
jgi:hypothetical protein